jgi:FkbM family methyltransferase
MVTKLDFLKTFVAHHLLEDGDTAIDIGACHGLFTRFFKKMVGPKGRVIAYEPHPVNFEELQDLWGGDDKVTLIQKAVSNESHQALLLREPQGHKDFALQQSTLEPTFQYFWGQTKERVSHKVVTEKLDDLFQRDPLKRLKLIKIDVEGHEASVIEGARKLLTARHPFVFFEYGFAAGLFEPKTIEMMQELNYDCYNVEDGKLFTSQRKIEGFADFLAVPKGYKDPLLETILFSCTE